MNRFVFAALIGLMLAIGLTVASMAWRTIAFDQPLPNLGTADPAVGYAFYDGIDQVLAGKGRDALDRVLSKGYVDHSGNAEMNRTAGELVDQLTTFGAAFPGTQVVVSDIEAAPGTLVASIAPLEPSGATVAGLPLTIEPLAGGFEVLRVRDGKVTERWSSRIPVLETRTPDEVGFHIGATFNGSTRLDRIELPAASSVELTIQGQSVVMVESGSVRIGIRETSQSTVVELQAGQAARLPDGAHIKLEREGDTTARLLRYLAQVVMPVDPTPPVITGSATSSMLWTSILPVIENGSWNISIGALRLPAGAEGQLRIAEDAALVIYSEVGSLRLETPYGVIARLDEHFWPSALGTTASVDAGHAANIEETDLLDLHSAAGDTIWLISIAPENAAATPAASPPRAVLPKRTDRIATMMAFAPPSCVMFCDPARCSSIDWPTLGRLR